MYAQLDSRPDLPIVQMIGVWQDECGDYYRRAIALSQGRQIAVMWPTRVTLITGPEYILVEECGCQWTWDGSVRLRVCVDCYAVC